MERDIASLANPNARFVPRKDWSVGMYFDQRPPRYLLGWGDVAFAFFRQDGAALSHWVGDLKAASGAPDFQIIATETFAKTLTRQLMKQVEAAN